ncbi:MAG: peptidylprolyl isomerase, partial [Clostridia bacterium]|nr:peptidylprolyl isomerase [Clostridia bacterium]
LNGQEVNIKGEFSANGVNNTISHQKGVISMARSSDYNSASSQFFICNADASASLDGQYAAFGYVYEGIEVVDKITQDVAPKATDTNGTIQSADQPVIKSIKVIEE